MKNPDTITVELHAYGPISAHSAEYKDLRAKLKEYPRFRVWEYPAGAKRIKSGSYKISTKHLFANQSVTLENVRIFDFVDYSRAPDTADIRYGHYIADLTALNAAREIQCACGYCGYRADNATGVWCPKCRGSEYLTPKDYPLLQMLPVRTTLTRETQPPADVLTQIRHEQGINTAKRTEKRIKAKFEKLKQDMKDAQTEADFLRLCISRGVVGFALDNLIYYPHSDTFTFGWRDRLTEDQAQEIRAALADVQTCYTIEFLT